MTGDIALTLLIISIAVVLFATEKLRVDVIALLVLLTLALTGLVSSSQAFAGFANPAVVTVWAVYIVSAGLFRTGVADALGERILKVAGYGEMRLIALIMATCGLMSAFMNNIGATAVLLPAVAGVARKTDIPLSRLLIPLAFSSLLGGNMTLIGTPPNILASSIMAERGLTPFQFFDFTPTGMIVFAAGVLYMMFLGRHLLPVRVSVEDWQGSYPAREYVSELVVTAESPLAGRTLEDARLGADFDLTVLAVLQDGVTNLHLTAGTILRVGDHLLVEGGSEEVLQAQERWLLVAEAERTHELAKVDDDESIVIEATLAPRASILGRTLRGLRFRDRFGFTALAIWRHGEIITQRLRDVRLQFGDALLLKGPRTRVSVLQEGADFLLLEPVLRADRRSRRAPLALGVVGLVLLLTTLGDLNIAVAMVIGALAMVLTGCLSMDEAYQSIEWRSVFLIAGMLPLGMAMETNGTARYLADAMIAIVGDFGPLALLAGIYILASLITEPMSNAAAAVLIVPIAIDVALEASTNPHAFVLATVIGASTSFLTPVGHQANVLVFGPGGYRFFDYTRVGAPLNVLLFVVTMVVVPLLWPL